MNRLILIGNGFDIAHELETSYKAFIFDYLKTSFLKCINQVDKLYEDNLLKIYSPNSNYYISATKNYEDYNFADLYEIIETKGKGLHNKSGALPLYMVKIKSEFLYHLVIYCQNCNWVDIENEYYQLLCKYTDQKNQEDKIKQLNDEFQTLQDLLQEYLLSINKTIPVSINNYFNNDICEQLTEPTHVTKVKPSNILFLNFNYTETIEYYLNGISRIVPISNVIYIHGQLGLPKNPMIFGYGDEDDTNFSILEKNDECLKYVKTYRYLRTDNYARFLDFIESGDYEVYIMGHSCGMSDKTMLSSIFNSDYCKKIKILTYNKEKGQNPSLQTTNYIEMTYQIGRLFNKKSDLRKKLIHFSTEDLLQMRRKK